MTSNPSTVRGSSESRGYVKFGSLAAAQLLRVLPRTRISRAVGQLCDRPLPPAISKAIVGLYANAWGVDLNEAEGLGEGETYSCFDAFFTRRLRAGVRAWPTQGDVLVSPSDGVLEAVGEVSDHGDIEVKGKRYRAAELLCGEADLSRYRGGGYAVIYLSPRDYHRVHAPADGRLVCVRSAPGDLFPVNGLSAGVPRLLSRNRRVAIVLDSEHFGRLTLVMVAAMLVGRVTVTGLGGADVPTGTHIMEPALDLAKGDELGVFHLGSTVVLFLPSESGGAWQRAPGSIRLGQPLLSPESPRDQRREGLSRGQS